MIVRLSLVMNRTVVDSDSRFNLTTCAVEAPVTVNHNPLQDCTVPQMIPRPQMIPKMDRKWSSTASDPESRPQMIPWKLEEWNGFYGTDYKKGLLYSHSSGRLYSSYQKSHNMTLGFKQLLNPMNVDKALASIIWKSALRTPTNYDK